MALTLPTVFNNYRGRDSSGSCFILKLTDGTNVWYISTKNIYLATDGIHTRAVARAIGPIRQNTSPVTLRYEMASATAELSSEWGFRDTNGYWVNILDVATKIMNRPALIYWHAGGIADALSETLLSFSGFVNNISFGESSFTVQMDERWSIRHRDLPQRKMSTTLFPDLPKNLVDVYMPLVYGNMSEGTWPSTSSPKLRQRGIAIAEQVQRKALLKYLIADHVVGSIGAPFLYMEKIESWARAVTFPGGSSTKDEDDGGRATAVIDPLSITWYAYLFPSKAYLASTGSDGGNPVGLSAITDSDSDSKMSVIADTTTTAYIYFEWEQNGGDANDSIENEVAELLDAANTLEMYLTIAGGVTVTARVLQVYDGSSWVDMTWPTPATVGDGIMYPFTLDNYNWASGTNGTFWHLATGPKGGDGTPFKIRLKLTGSGWTANSTVVAYVHEARLRIRCRYVRHRKTGQINGFFPNPFGGSRPQFSLPGQVARIPDAERLGFECTGRVFGSWIDGGRSNPYNAGDAIIGPQYTIESILRDELEVPSADIDTASFDAFSSTINCYVALNGNTRINSQDIIEAICYEHGILFFRSPDGKIKVVDYLGSSSTDELHPHDLIGLPRTSIIFPSGSKFGNDIDVFHTLIPFEDKHARVTNSTDSSSDTAYGTAPNTEQLDTIRQEPGGTAQVTRFMNRIIDSERMYSRPHRLVILPTRGNRWAAKELGDKFTLNSTEFDPQRKCFGDSWSGLSLVIIGKQTDNSVITFDTIIWSPASI